MSSLLLDAHASSWCMVMFIFLKLHFFSIVVSSSSSSAWKLNCSMYCYAWTARHGTAQQIQWQWDLAALKFAVNECGIPAVRTQSSSSPPLPQLKSAKTPAAASATTTAPDEKVEMLTDLHISRYLRLIWCYNGRARPHTCIRIKLRHCKP